MRDAGGEAADRLELVRLAQLDLDREPLCDLLAHLRVAGDGLPQLARHDRARDERVGEEDRVQDAERGHATNDREHDAGREQCEERGALQRRARCERRDAAGRNATAKERVDHRRQADAFGALHVRDHQAPQQIATERAGREHREAAAIRSRERPAPSVDAKR